VIKITLPYFTLLLFYNFKQSLFSGIQHQCDTWREEKINTNQNQLKDTVPSKVQLLPSLS